MNFHAINYVPKFPNMYYNFCSFLHNYSENRITYKEKNANYYNIDFCFCCETMKKV